MQPASGERLTATRRSRQQPIKAALALVLAMLLVGAADAQQQPSGQSRIQTTVEMVVVPVTVKDGAGGLVTGLGRDEFRVLEDGVEQHIAVFSADSVPLSVVVLLDDSLPQKTAERVQASLVAMAGAFSEADEVALLLFDQFTKAVFDLTTDKDKVFNQLRRLHLASNFPGEGSAVMTTGPRINATPVEPKVSVPPIRTARQSKNIDDAVYAAAQLLRHRPRERRKIILLISDGHNSRNNAMSFDDTLRLLLSADVSLYAVDLSPALLGPESSVLARYARMTGGDDFRANKRAELEPLYARITEQARNQYTMAYVPRGTNRAREFHSIDVRVRRPGLTILARDGYFTGGVP